MQNENDLSSSTDSSESSKIASNSNDSRNDQDLAERNVPQPYIQNDQVSPMVNSYDAEANDPVIDENVDGSQYGHLLDRAFTKYSQYTPPTQQVFKIPIELWKDLPFIDSDYSQYWKSTSMFEPSNYYEMSRKNNNKIRNLFMFIAFILNLIGTLVLLFYMVTTYDDDKNHPSYGYWSGNFSDVGTTILIGFGISFVLMMIYDVLISCLPNVFLTGGIALGIIFLIASTVLFIFYGTSYGGVIFAAIFTVFSFFNIPFQIHMKSFSLTLLKFALHIGYKFKLNFHKYLFVIISYIIALVFVFIIYLVQRCNISNLVYIYVVISYFWITQTFSYIPYLYNSAVTSDYYFLRKSKHFPKKIKSHGIKRAIVQLGQAALAGAVLPYVKFLSSIGYTSVVYEPSNLPYLYVAPSFEGISILVLLVFEKIFNYFTPYTLCYASMWNLPTRICSNRLKEVEFTRYTSIFNYGNIIDNQSGFYLTSFVISAGFFGYIIGDVLYKNEYILKVFLSVFAAIFTFSVLTTQRQSINGISNTILICFGEMPFLLKKFSRGYIVFVRFQEFYDKYLGEIIFRQKTKQEKRRRR